MTLRLTVVPTQNAEGEELGELVRAWAASTLRGKVRAEVELARTNKDVQDALMSDLVILDLSVAPEGEHNYDILARFPRYRDFMFLVSRTPVPFNVRWGANRAVPLFPRRQTNQEIVSWLAREISINTIDQYARGWLDRIKSAARSAIQWQIWERSQAALRRVEQDRAKRPRAFVSFRGANLDNAREVVRLIQDAENPLSSQMPHQAILYDGEILALRNELLPEMLRWQVLAIISDDVKSSSDFVVVQSDDYLRSWWTQGELFTCGYACIRPRMHVYDVGAGKLTGQVEGYVFDLTEEEKDVMSKFFTNSHPELVAPESAGIYRFMEMHQGEWWTRLASKEVSRLQYHEDFERLLLLQCDRCTQRLWGDVIPRDFGAFIRGEYPVMHRVEPEPLERAARAQERISCPDPACNQQFEISIPPPHYIWYPPHIAQRFVEEIKQPRLMMLQTYIAQAATT